MRPFPPLAALMLLCYAAVPARDIGLGTVELAGSGYHEMRTTRTTSEIQIAFRPEVAVYLLPWFHVGPVFGYGGSWTEVDDPRSPAGNYDYSGTSLSAGGKAGFLINYSQGLGRPLPFFAGAYSGDWWWSEFRGESSGRYHGPILALSAGAKMKISESFLIAVFHEYSHRNILEEADSFRFGFGFSGIL